MQASSSVHLPTRRFIASSIACCCPCQASTSRSAFVEVVRSRSRRTAKSWSSTAAGIAPAIGHSGSDPGSQSSTAPKRTPLSSFFRKSFRDQLAGSTSDSSAGRVIVASTASSTSHVSSPSSLSSLTTLPDLPIPPIATPTSAWRSLARPSTLQAQLGIYKQLAKGRLSAWVVLTAMVGYAMCPTDPGAAAMAMEALVQDTFGSTAGAVSGSIHPVGLPEATASAMNTFKVTTLLATATGTALCSASANTFNQLLEIPYDAQMPRTAKRPLPSHLITPLHAFTFGSLTGIAGSTLLFTCVNPLTASLGLLNIVLYAGIYTPLKRLSVTNTWIGALVGGIPPLMGWAACTNSLDPFSGQAGAWVLATILFAWQFPHFNALSWSIRSEYARGGYRMLSAVNPGMNARVSLRWTIAGAAAAAVGAPLVGLTSWAVGIASLVPSGALGLYAWRFWRAGSKASLERARTQGVMQAVKGARATDKDPRDAPARSLFFVSLVHLPALLLMMMGGKIIEGWWGQPKEVEGEEGLEITEKASSTQ